MSDQICNNSDTSVLNTPNNNATYCDGTDTRRITVTRGASGRMYADFASAYYDCERDALIETDEPGTYKSPHTGCYIEMDQA